MKQVHITVYTFNYIINFWIRASIFYLSFRKFNSIFEHPKRMQIIVQSLSNTSHLSNSSSIAHFTRCQLARIYERY